MKEFSLPREEVVLRILEKYADTVYRLAFSRTKSSHDAEDIMQNVFIKFIKCDVNFESEEHIKAWLIRVTINLSKNLLASAMNWILSLLVKNLKFKFPNNQVCINNQSVIEECLKFIGMEEVK